jgi:hypothetical protein
MLYKLPGKSYNNIENKTAPYRGAGGKPAENAHVPVQTLDLIWVMPA